MTIDNHILCVLFHFVLQINIVHIDVYEKFSKDENTDVRKRSNSL
jgi:hypothetical protein